MSTNPPFVDLLGLASGAIVALSATPRVIEIARNGRKAATESIIRNSALVAGNLGWIAYGVLTGTVPIAMMCSVAVLLNGTVLCFAVRARRQL